MPLRTSSRTALMYGPSLGSVSRSASRSSAFQDRQAGADQGDELLVEDQELLQVQLLAAAEKPAADGRRGVRGLIE